MGSIGTDGGQHFIVTVGADALVNLATLSAKLEDINLVRIDLQDIVRVSGDDPRLDLTTAEAKELIEILNKSVAAIEAA
ncbi:hypothetical protein QM588_05180 [Rhodococcus sp. IEGM 1354]|uniref:hypothetical protein n=1 Tax=Rhodococcus sp. IEGM 1354 TaxID=3047088 RepID=UPI0024B7A0A8|nr:hypothetical protein [Rhodococcus sp. IEGM 1354]MDI9929790.1 hypothetical protein [Rhodococcus sp. IEGM 1354]